MTTVKFDLLTFLEKHHSFNTKVQYDPEELLEMIDTARVLFSGENALVEVGIPVIVVGDIHGQIDELCEMRIVDMTDVIQDPRLILVRNGDLLKNLLIERFSWSDLQRILAACGQPGKTRYLFLGDYVDRGPQSLECISYLVAWKIAYPKKVYLLRGNHEFATINRDYGFYDELISRFSMGQGMKLWKEFNDLFSVLPFAGLIRKRILCMHGGLSPHLNRIDDIKAIRLPVFECSPNTLEQDLIWADPKLELQGFEPNKLRNVSVSFGTDVVLSTCKKLKLDLVIRAHQVMDNGYGFFAGRKLVTLFSAPLYAELKNKGAVMSINSSMLISYVIFNPTNKKTAGEENFQKLFKDDQASYIMNQQVASVTKMNQS